MNSPESIKTPRRSKAQARAAASGSNHLATPMPPLSTIRDAPFSSSTPNPTSNSLRDSPRLARSTTLVATEEIGKNSGTGEPMGLPPEWAALLSAPTPTPPRQAMSKEKPESQTQLPTLKRTDVTGAGSKTGLVEKDEKSDKPEKSAERKRKKVLLRELEELHIQVETLKRKVESKNQEIEALQARWLRNTGHDISSEENARAMQAYSACVHATENKTDLLELMLRHGADILLPMCDGNTALHCAARSGHGKVVSFLLNSGAPIDARNHFGQTAWDVAVLSRHYAIIQLLDEAKAFREFKSITKDYALSEYIPLSEMGARKVHPHETVHLQRQLSKLTRFFGTGDEERQQSALILSEALTGGGHSSTPRQLISQSLPGHKLHLQKEPKRVAYAPTSHDTHPTSNPGSQSHLDVPSPGTTINGPQILSFVVPPSQAPTSLNRGSSARTASAAHHPIPSAYSDPYLTQSSTTGGPNGKPSGSRSGSLALSHSTTAMSPSTGSSSSIGIEKKPNHKSVGRIRRLFQALRHGSSSPATSSKDLANHPDSLTAAASAARTYGIAFGRLRGACQSAECHCTCFSKDKSVPGAVVCVCTHFPATHEDLGESQALETNLLAGLEHLNITEESQELLLEKEPGVPWPKILNPLLPEDETSHLFSDIQSYAKESIIDQRDVEFHKQLGKGASATVYAGTFRTADQRKKAVAIKVVDFMPSSKRPIYLIQHEITEELRIMRAFSQHSDRVVKFYGVVTQPRLCILMELCECGSLTDVLSNPKIRLDWPLFFTWAYQITQAVLELHSWDPPIVHRDLKSLNLLVDSQYNVKVADFGLSRFLQPDENQTTLGKMRGTYAFTDPEIYDGVKFSPKADMYSLGIIMWEIAHRMFTGVYLRPYGEFPWMNRDFQIIVQVARKNVRPTIPQVCPPPLADVMRSLWTRVGSERPTSRELLGTFAAMQKQYEANEAAWDALLPAVSTTAIYISVDGKEAKGAIGEDTSTRPSLATAMEMLSSSSSASEPSKMQHSSASGGTSSSSPLHLSRLSTGASHQISHENGSETTSPHHSASSNDSMGFIVPKLSPRALEGALKNALDGHRGLSPSSAASGDSSADSAANFLQSSVSLLNHTGTIFQTSSAEDGAQTYDFNVTPRVADSQSSEAPTHSPRSAGGSSPSSHPGSAKKRRHKGHEERHDKQLSERDRSHSTSSFATGALESSTSHPGRSRSRSHKQHSQPPGPPEVHIIPPSPAQPRSDFPGNPEVPSHSSRQFLRRSAGDQDIKAEDAIGPWNTSKSAELDSAEQRSVPQVIESSSVPALALSQGHHKHKHHHDKDETSPSSTKVRHKRGKSTHNSQHSSPPRHPSTDISAPAIETIPRPSSTVIEAPSQPRKSKHKRTNSSSDTSFVHPDPVFSSASTPASGTPAPFADTGYVNHIREETPLASQHAPGKSDSAKTKRKDKS